MEKIDIEKISELRNILIEKLKNYQKDNKIYLDLDNQLLDQIIFDDYNNRKKITIDFELLKKLDLSNISFDNVEISNLDFTGSKGAKINPQTVYDKNCWNVNFKDAKIIGSFTGSYIVKSKFKGSKGAEINPSQVKCQDCRWIDFADAKIIGQLTGVNINGANFEGSILAFDYNNKEEIITDAKKRIKQSF